MKAAPALVAVLALAAAGQASAQVRTYGGYDQSRTWNSHGGYGYDYNGQQDRPGDYRCDAYWDRGRDDCGDAWRDQRPYSRGYSSYRTGYDNGRYNSGGYQSYGQGYGQSYGQGGYHYVAPYTQGTQYYGAYGRPDQVYPGGGSVWNGSGGHDANRSAWCRSQYRSYDPATGFYRAYSGRLVFCG